MAKKQKTKAFSFQGFDSMSFRVTEQYTAVVNALFDRATAAIADAASRGQYKPEKPFSFDDYPSVKSEVNKITTSLASNMTTVIEAGSRKQWLFACKKNDEFIQSILDTTKMRKAALQKMQDRNLDALQTFQQRKVNGMDLSQRVWKYTEQYKDQIELGLDVGLGEGRSAQQLSRDLRQNLQDPDRLFRRVRDKRGNLHLSKAAKAFHPGQGVYRSSYKNAMRLTRSEVNMAYREADWLRWQQLDFVVGFEIRRSNHEPEYKCKLCDRLVGRYPKAFKFKGWHPQCRCHCVPILNDYEELREDRVSRFKAAINGTEYKKHASKNTITEMPEEFTKWVAENAEKQASWNTTPYFIRDNFVNGNLGEGLKLALTKVVKPIKTAEQRADIQARWNTRVATVKYSEQLDQLSKGDFAPSIKKIIERAIDSISKGKSIVDIDAMMAKIGHKIDVKKEWDERVETRQLETLLVDVKGLKTQFDMPTIKSVFEAVKKKLESWDALTLEEQAKKLTFEIEWVETNKKYDTWQAAQAAYKKRLVMVEYLLGKQNIQTDTSHAFSFAQTTKSANIKQLAIELNTLLDNNAPIAQLKQKASSLNNEVAKLEAAKAARDAKKFGLSDDSYAQNRKDAAIWAKQSKKADSELRDVCGEIWRAASDEERTSAYRYTAGSSYINEPLRNMNYTGQYLGKYDSQKDINSLTSIISKSYYKKDIWIQRGVDMNGASGLFGESLNSTNATKLIGKVCTEKAFSSCAATKGKGFSHKQVIYNIYCPSGTKMLYCEPFSAFGAGARSPNWDGVSKQSTFHDEVEVLLQRNTTFRITKVEQSGNRWFIDMEVISQL